MGLDIKHQTGVNKTITIRLTEDQRAYLTQVSKKLYGEGLIYKESLSAAARHIIGQAQKEEGQK